MTYRGHMSRAELGLRPPRSRSTNFDPSVGGVTGHWAGPAQKVSPLLSGHTRCINLWRGYQNYHMDEHGWVDLAYTMGACQHGYLLAGRGAGVRTAANGTNEGNYGWYAICAILGDGEKPTKDCMDAWWAGVKMLQQDGGAASRVNEHSDHKSTTCAGTFGDAIKNGEPPMADHDHELTKMPDWKGAAQRFWDKFVADGITSVTGSWKRPVWRIDLAWLYSKTIVPLKEKLDKLATRVTKLESDVVSLKVKIDSLSSSGSQLTESHIRAIAKGEINKAKIKAD